MIPVEFLFLLVLMLLLVFQLKLVHEQVQVFIHFALCHLSNKIPFKSLDSVSLSAQCILKHHMLR